MGQHTKGPWEVEETLAHPYLPTKCIVDKEGFLIAQQIHKQDAALIAAAPELLEALKALVSDNADMEAPSDYILLKEKARKAIARAQGQ